MNKTAESSPLHEAVILQTAARVAGPGLAQDHEFRPALAALVNALREACPDPAEARSAAAEMVACAVTRAQIAATVARDPSILEEPVPAPIFITGLPRSGTTLLQNLFAANPACRVLRRWELQAPARPHDAGPSWEHRLVREAERRIQTLHRRKPELLDIHPMAATAPEECSMLFRHCFASMSFCWRAPLPSYAAWLLSADMVPVYRHYRMQLQLLLRRAGGVLVLKDPSHLWHLRPLLSVFPDARVIRMHRDARETVPSWCSLYRALRSRSERPGDPVSIGAEILARMRIGHQRAASVQASAPPGVFIHQDFKELVADPIATMRSLHEKLSLGFSNHAEASARRWLVDFPTHTRHRYRLTEFGLRNEDLEGLD